MFLLVFSNYRSEEKSFEMRSLETLRSNSITDTEDGRQRPGLGVSGPRSLAAPDLV